jgi:hypothetical protein
MQIPITMMTDKVMSMIKSMVVLAMRVSYRRGATAEDISGFLRAWSPDNERIYHAGLVERALFDLQAAGAVTRAGARWYPVGLSA